MLKNIETKSKIWLSICIFFYFSVVDEVVSKVIADKNLTLLAEVISSFSFISERCLVFILKFLIELPEEPDILQSNKNTTNKIIRKEPISNSISSTKLDGLTNGIDEDSLESPCIKMDIDVDDNNDTEFEGSLESCLLIFNFLFNIAVGKYK